MLKRFLAMIISTILLVMCSTAMIAQCAEDKPSGNPLESSYTKNYSEKAGLRYLMSFPKGYSQDSDKKWPTILFLHGAGGISNDFNKLINIPPMKVLGTYISEHEDFPFIVIYPQCDNGMDWDFLTTNLNILIDDVASSYQVDTDRLYVTGYSMGGFGTWELGMCSPERFAALAPMAGGGDPENIANLQSLPVWAFHGDSDHTVDISRDRVMVDALERSGGNVKFTVYPGKDHMDIADLAINSELFDWFLEHTRSNDVHPVEQKIADGKIVELQPGKVAFAQARGKNCEAEAWKTLSDFIKANKLNIHSDLKVFGFSLPRTKELDSGYEVCVYVNSEVSETVTVKMKDFSGGLYAVASADETGVKELNKVLYNASKYTTFKQLFRWMALSNYKYDAENRETLDEMIIDDSLDIVNFRMYIPVVEKS